MRDWRFWLAENRGTLVALAIFLVMFTIYVSNHPAGFTANVVNTAANKGVLLALVAMAQTMVVLTSGIDLSVGTIFVLCNCVASHLLLVSPLGTIFGLLVTLAVGALCGAINGVLVIFGRLQPIVATIATGAVYYGLALWLRPDPGVADDFNGDFCDLFTGKLAFGVPASLVALTGVVLIVWAPFSRSALGRAAYAVGSSELSAYMSGAPVKAAKFSVYVLAGLLAGIGGLYLTFLTQSGEASSANASSYTLFSIASVVLGGVSLFGGSGSAIGAIFGALAFRAIGDLLFVFNIEPLWQPLFQGVVLLASVSIGAARLVGVRNRLELFG